MYVFGQILGALLAALGLFQKDIIEYGSADLAKGGTLSCFATFPGIVGLMLARLSLRSLRGPRYSPRRSSLGDDTNAPLGAGMNVFILGLVITVCSMAFGYNISAAMNPSPDLGPRLAVLAVGYGGEVFRNGYWIYGPWVAMISGAILGVFLYDAAIFVGGESPVNYPRESRP